MSIFSTRLQEELSAAGKSAYWLAGELGVSYQAVYKWLHGEYPTMDNVMRVAECLRIPAGSLLTRDVDLKSMALGRTLLDLPPESRKSALDHLLWQISRAADRAVAEERAKYLRDVQILETFRDTE